MAAIKQRLQAYQDRIADLERQLADVTAERDEARAKLAAKPAPAKK